MSEIEALLLPQEARIERDKMEYLSMDSLSVNIANTQLRGQNLNNSQ